MSPRFHAGAWLAWTASATLVVLVVENPLATVAAVGALVAVARAFAPDAPEGRAYRLMLRLGLVFAAIRVALFALTGHTGPTTIVELPSVSLPAWLGGFGIGGRVTAEVVATAATEGLEIAAVLVCAGVFMSVVDHARVLRLLPAFLHEAGLVLAIAVGFVPTMLRSAATIRDAQRTRGHRFRGVRAARALVVPVLGDALERSLTLAAAMEVRGFGHGRPADRPREGHARAAVLGGVVAIGVGAELAMFGRTAAGIALCAAGAVGVVAGARAVPSAHVRTRYSPDRWTAWDTALVSSAVATAAAALAARALEAARWYAYPVAAWPEPDARLVAVMAALASPLALDAARAVRLARASRAALVPEVPS